MVHDVMIIGGGGAGMTAAIYSARARLSTVMIEKAFSGGQLMMCEHIENFPGFPKGVSGIDLAMAMREQADKFGLEHKNDEVVSVDFSGDEKVAWTASGDTISAKTVALSLGARPRLLGCPGEGEFLGRGVSYCAVCDAAFFKDKKVVVVGGGDTAVEDSLYLTKFASDITIIHRRDKLRAQAIIQERTLANPKISVKWNSVVKSVGGTESVDHVVIEDVNTGEMSKLDTDAVFVLVGTIPNTKFLEGIVELDELGYIPTDQNMQTNVAGVFAAGDCRQKLLRQIITACGDGATAATAAEKYIEGILPV